MADNLVVPVNVMASSESCSICRFYKRNLQNMSEGFCRRLPPVPIMMPHKGPPGFRVIPQFPYMDGTDWCGEWKLSPRGMQ